jgi:hypothetical protein
MAEEVEEALFKSVGEAAGEAAAVVAAGGRCPSEPVTQKERGVRKIRLKAWSHWRTSARMSAGGPADVR